MNAENSTETEVPVRSGTDRRVSERRKSVSQPSTVSATSAVKALLAEQKAKPHPFHGRPPLEPVAAAIWNEAKSLYMATKHTDAVARILSEQLAKPVPFRGHPPVKPAKRSVWNKAKAQYNEQRQSSAA